MTRAHLVSLSSEEKREVWLGSFALPLLEEEVLGDEIVDAEIEDTFRDGLDEWWASFISGDCL